jgi:CheY-like chemotaxis protein
LTVIRKPEATVEAAGGSQLTSSLSSSPARTLVSLLELAFGDAAPAHAAIAHALAAAGREELPSQKTELVAFVRAHLLSPISEQIGARLTMALVDDLVEKLDALTPLPVEEPIPSSEVPPPPSSVPRPIARIATQAPQSQRVRKGTLGILLVDGDRVARTAVARALLRAQWDVTVVESMADLATALDSEDAVHVALVDAAHPVTHALLETIAQKRPDTVVVARSSDSIRMRAHLVDLGITRFDVRAREAPAEELVDAIKRTLKA